MVPASSSRISGRDGSGRTVRAQLHKEVGGIGAVVVGGEPDGVRRFNTGDGQKLGGTDDDLVSLGPGLEDVAGATVGAGAPMPRPLRCPTV